ncbi:tyrosine-type recombinase/integrase [Sporosarcina newyorkensis]|nr:tyrosine-type recombinase/integrase [Sporosarcina newyorkensis]
MTNQMQNVQPIRTTEDIAKFIDAIITASPKTADRNVLLFKLGVSTGLRIGDLVKLRIEDVRGRASVLVMEGKTKKAREVYLDDIMPEIADYLADKPAEGYLFASAKGGHITPTQAYRALDKAADMLDWDFIGTHTLRKTFGYFYYKKTKDLVTLSEILNHSSQQITRRYIGIRDEDIRESVRGLGLF